MAKGTRITNNVPQGDFTVTEISDNQHPYPSLKEMRASQKQGGTGRGLPENSTGKLNEVHGHNVEIRYAGDKATFLSQQVPERIEDDNG